MESRVFLPSAVVAVLLAAAVGAQAADLPVTSQSRNGLSAAPTSPYDWTGFYVGAQIGYGWGQSSGTQNAGGTFFPVVPYSLDPAGALPAATSASPTRPAPLCWGQRPTSKPRT